MRPYLYGSVNDILDNAQLYNDVPVRESFIWWPASHHRRDETHCYSHAVECHMNGYAMD